MVFEKNVMLLLDYTSNLFVLLIHWVDQDSSNIEWMRLGLLNKLEIIAHMPMQIGDTTENSFTKNIRIKFEKNNKNNFTDCIIPNNY